MGVMGQICLFIFGMEICPCNTMSASLNGKKNPKDKNKESLTFFQRKYWLKTQKNFMAPHDLA